MREKYINHQVTTDMLQTDRSRERPKKENMHMKHKISTNSAKVQVQNPKNSCSLSVGILIFNAKCTGLAKCLNDVRIF